MNKILIADDQESWRLYHQHAIRKILGDSVAIELTESAEAAYSKLLESKSAPYDIMITDLQMENNYLPKLAGEWLIEQVKSLQFCYKMKIIIISGANQIKQIADLYNVDYIRKNSVIHSSEEYKKIIQPY